MEHDELPVEKVEAAEIVNLCPHDITLLVGDQALVLSPAGLARCVEEREELGEAVAGGIHVPLVRCRYRRVVGLPDPVAGRVYVVSHLVAERCLDRYDLVVPDQLVRDDDGVIIAARALALI
jgi:hypothetical protein